MHIRSFKPEDTKAVIELWKACGLVVQWNDPAKDIERKIITGTDLFLVGVVDTEIVAGVMGGYDGHRGWVNYLAVSPNHQRKRYGKQLMRALETQLLTLGCPKINLQIRDTNLDVIAFYEQIGYTNDNVISFGKRLIPDN